MAMNGGYKIAFAGNLCILETARRSQKGQVFTCSFVGLCRMR